uniref:Uncharacterized protein n=1 Tax=Anguilla anguilla TaxID=7936 RepID=A0A0E9QYQ6_ANGAN
MYTQKTQLVIQGHTKMTLQSY